MGSSHTQKARKEHFLGSKKSPHPSAELLPRALGSKMLGILPPFFAKKYEKNTTIGNGVSQKSTTEPKPHRILKEGSSLKRSALKGCKGMGKPNTQKPKRNSSNLHNHTKRKAHQRKARTQHMVEYPHRNEPTFAGRQKN